MSDIEKSIVVRAPLKQVYDQWTQFEEFPQFMEGVLEVRQLDARTLHWRARIAGVEQEWEAEIVDQVPDTRIAWKSTSGSGNAGAVNFEALPDGGTEVRLHMRYDPEGVIESVGDSLGVMSHQVARDLERFRTFIEERDGATGGWRGEIHGARVDDRSAPVEMLPGPSHREG